MSDFKFDPAKAHLLDSPERETFLPDGRLIDLLDLQGNERVLDYGTGTGRLALAAAARLTGDGQVDAVDESDEMLNHLRQRLAEEGGEPGPDTQASGESHAGAGEIPARIVLYRIEKNHVPLADRSVDRILAVNLLHEIRGEAALLEMHRLLKPGGLLLVADWVHGLADKRSVGPPDHALYTAEEAIRELEEAGFKVKPTTENFPYHFILLGNPS